MPSDPTNDREQMLSQDPILEQGIQTERNRSKSAARYESLIEAAEEVADCDEDADGYYRVPATRMHNLIAALSDDGRTETLATNPTQPDGEDGAAGLLRELSEACDGVDEAAHYYDETKASDRMSVAVDRHRRARVAAKNYLATQPDTPEDDE